MLFDLPDSIRFWLADHLKRPLDKYFRNHPKVKIVRAPKRGGLIKARLLGFAVAKGEVVVFLDSHIECTKGKINVTSPIGLSGVYHIMRFPKGIGT